jgi:glycosyltransferase involved in cell wall biosynthesis
MSRWLMRTLAPDLVLTPSLMLLDELGGLGVRAEFLPMGVDHERFVPVRDGAAKKQLRRAYGVVEDGHVVLHVGHLQPGRNLGWMRSVRELTGATVLVVAGTAMGRDERTVQLLDAMDVKLLNTYFAHVEEIYQLADAYVFPVQDAGAAIGVPLSVLEAMACNLPVVTTPFGGLPRMFEEGDGLFFASDAHQFASLTRCALEMPRAEVSTRQLALRYSWRRVVGQIVEMAAGL